MLAEIECFHVLLRRLHRRNRSADTASILVRTRYPSSFGSFRTWPTSGGSAMLSIPTMRLTALITYPCRGDATGGRSRREAPLRPPPEETPSAPPDTGRCAAMGPFIAAEADAPCIRSNTYSIGIRVANVMRPYLESVAA